MLNRHSGRRGRLRSRVFVIVLTDPDPSWYTDVDSRFTGLCGQAVGVCRISPGSTVLQGQALWPCGKWLWLNSCASWVRIPASPTYWRKVGGKRRTEGRRWVEERVFRRHNYWLHAPHLYLKTQMKNEIIITTTYRLGLSSILTVGGASLICTHVADRCSVARIQN